MHKEACFEKGKSPVFLEKYTLTFNDYNIGFHIPKKNHCKVGECYRSFSPDDRNEPL